MIIYDNFLRMPLDTDCLVTVGHSEVRAAAAHLAFRHAGGKRVRQPPEADGPNGQLQQFVTYKLHITHISILTILLTTAIVSCFHLESAHCQHRLRNHRIGHPG